MPNLILEDGSMPSMANTYVTLEDADAYLTLRGEWEETPSSIDETTGDTLFDESIVIKKQRSLIRAFDTLNLLQWKGYAVQYGRTVAWPRKNVIVYDPENDKEIILDSDIVPMQVVQAQIELAALIYNGLKPLEAQTHKGLIHSISESHTDGNLDVIGGDHDSKSITFVNGVSAEAYLPSVYGYIRDLLAVVPGESAGVTQSLVEVG